MKKLTHLSELLKSGSSAQCIVVHSGAAHPTVLAGQLAELAPQLSGCRVHALTPCGPVPYAQAPARDHLDLTTFLPGAGLRGALDAKRLQVMRRPLSGAPQMFAQAGAVDAVLLRVSPPDSAGRVSLGVSVDYMPAALSAACCVVAEIDPLMPRVTGDAGLSVDRIDLFVDAVDGPHEIGTSQADPLDEAIAGHIASLLDDGAVLQLGVGSLPDRVLSRLANFKGLGLHTGIIGDGAQALIEAGVIDNSRKAVLPGVSVATMALGTRAFYAFMDGNPAVAMHPCSFTHERDVLGRLRRLCAINAALQIDLHGRVNAEWAGARQVSSPGGLPDFARAAAAQPDGISIIALRACDRKGNSSIVAALSPDRPCSLQPNEVDCYVTEYGVADMRGRSAHERRKALIAIAHPAHRETLST